MTASSSRSHPYYFGITLTSIQFHHYWSTLSTQDQRHYAPIEVLGGWLSLPWVRMAHLRLKQRDSCRL